MLISRIRSNSPRYGAFFRPDSAPRRRSGYAVGFCGAPVGAALFGHFGDRLGRKVTLIATLLPVDVRRRLRAWLCYDPKQGPERANDCVAIDAREGAQWVGGK